MTTSSSRFKYDEAAAAYTIGFNANHSLQSGALLTKSLYL
jgi:hypothetical protein